MTSAVYMPLGQRKCHHTKIEMMLPRRKVHSIKLLLVVIFATIILTTIYYQFFHQLNQKTIRLIAASQDSSSLYHSNANRWDPKIQLPRWHDQNRKPMNNDADDLEYSPTPQSNQRLYRYDSDQLAPSVDTSNNDSYNSDTDTSESSQVVNNEHSFDQLNGEPHMKKSASNFPSRSRHPLRLRPEFLKQSSNKKENEDTESLDTLEDLSYESHSSFSAKPSVNIDKKVYMLNKPKEQDAQSVAVIPAPKESSGFGEMGRPVILKNLTEEQQDLVKVGWENNAFDQYISDLISLNRSLPDVRDSSCKPVRYPSVESLPKTSIIICFHNEAWSVLLRTVHSAINRSPKGLIEEIILVDDYSSKSYLKEQLEEYVRPLEIVKIVRADKREGLIRARLLGARHASGEVLTFLDSHCECAEGWLEPLLARINEDPTAVVCPVIDVISDKTFEYHYRGDAASISVGGFDWNLQFNWHSIPEREKARRKHPYDPIRSPTMAGGLFSISKDFFEKLGTYDSGFDIWGGENLELSFKTWMCGGKLEIIPCSHVGHVFRSRSPYKWRTGVNVLKRNSVRLAEVWMDEYKKYYYDRIGHELGDYGDIKERQKLRESLHCKPFSYYVKDIYPELFIPGEAVAYGEIRNIDDRSGNMCLDSPARKTDFKKPMGVYPCHSSGGNQYWLLSKDGEIRRDEACLDYAGQEVMLFPCHGSGGNQLWFYKSETKQIFHGTSGRCLQLIRDKLLMLDCDTSEESQKWKFQHYNATLAATPM